LGQSLIGLPKTFGSSMVIAFAVVVFLFSLSSLRTKPHEEPASLASVLVNGLLIGLIAGLGFALITFGFATLQARDVRVADVFAQISHENIEALTGVDKVSLKEGVSVLPGLIKLAGYFTLAGVLGGWITKFPASKVLQAGDEDKKTSARYWLTMVLPFVFFAFFLALRIEGVDIGGSEENSFGLVLLYAFIAASLFAFRQVKDGAHKIGLSVLVVALVLILPQLTDLKQNAILGAVMIFILMGIGLNIVVGFAGLLDLGYVAFFAVGAYTYALISSPESYIVVNLPWFDGLSFWAGLPIAVLLGALAGIMLGIPVLRMRGDYLAIVTLGFGEIIRLLLLNLRDYTGGPGGILEIPSPTLFGLDLGNPKGILYLGMAFALVITFVTIRLRDSRLGRAWVALREDEDVAQAMGINLVSIKLLAFASGAAFAALGGALYAARQVNIFPDNFALDVSINVLSLIIIGGIGSIEGVVLGSIALIGLPEILRSVDEYRIVAFGALLVIMMIIRPEGFLPSTRRARELHEGDDDAPVEVEA
jgi:branched-chain amino acid transport system permease protein